MPQASRADLEWDAPDVSGLVTEDDTPVDNFYCEVQMRFLTESLHSSWEGPPRAPGNPPRPFIAAANVGLYQTPDDAPPLVPDVMVSVDVKKPEMLHEKKNRVYFIWRLGKVPDLVIEIVSNREGGELDDKLRKYEKLRIPFYVVYDPECHLSQEALHVFKMDGDRLVETDERRFPRLNLGLTLWQGVYEGQEALWLRWTDAAGNLLPTGAERATDAEAKAADAETKAAGAEAKAAEAEAKVAGERARADEAEAREARLRARLRALGLDDDDEKK